MTLNKVVTPAWLRLALIMFATKKSHTAFTLQQADNDVSKSNDHDDAKIDDLTATLVRQISQVRLMAKRKKRSLTNSSSTQDNGNTHSRHTRTLRKVSVCLAVFFPQYCWMLICSALDQGSWADHVWELCNIQKIYIYYKLLSISSWAGV